VGCSAATCNTLAAFVCRAFVGLHGDAGRGFFDAYEYVLPDVLNTLYSLPAAMPWPRLRDSVHL
jgi:hypothetical protein